MDRGKLSAVARNRLTQTADDFVLHNIGFAFINSGAVYLGVLSLLALQPSALLGYGYLVLYNLIFVLPLVVILAAASARPTLNRLAHWNLHHKEWVRLALGGGVVVMGLLILATV